MMSSPPLLITIKPEKEDFGVRKLKTIKKGKLKGRQYGAIAKHQPLTCYFNWAWGGKQFEPCVAIYLDGISRWTQVIHVINHETVHHVLQWIQPNPLAASGSEDNYDGLDNLFSDYTKGRRFGF